MTAISTDLKATKELLRMAYKHQHSRESLDSIFLVSGEEGSGKSNGILNFIQYLEELDGQEITIDKIARNLKELIKALRYSKDKGFIALDEGTELASDRQFEQISKSLKNAFTIMREKALIVFLSFPNPFKVNTYFREDRSKGIFFITKRKYIHYFTRTKFQQIQRIMKVKNQGVKSIADFIKLYGHMATFRDTFPLYEGHLKDEYRARKKDNIDLILDELYQDFGVEEKLYSFNQACKYLDIPPVKLKDYIRYGNDKDGPLARIPVHWNLNKTKMRLKEKDLDDFREYMINKQNEPVDNPSGLNPETDKR